jgi:TldD protein
MSEVDLKYLKSLTQEWFKDAFYGDLYLERVETLKIVVEPDRIDEVNWGVEEGSAIRKITPEFTNKLYFSNGFFEKGLRELILQTKRPCEEEVSKKLTTRLEYLEELKKKVWSTKEIKHYRLFYSEVVKEVWIFTSEGKFLSDKREYTKLGVIVVAEKDGRLERGYEVAGRKMNFEQVKDLEEFLVLPERASRLATTMLSTKKAPAGVMPVVLAGQAGGTMIHEAVGHGLEADHAEEGLSVYSGKIGEKVASPLITVVDDPTIEGLYGSYQVDDEGVYAQPVVLIENGRLKTYLYDRLTAFKYQKTPNGHGRRQDYRCIPIPRMANTYIAKGPHKSEEILKSIEKGILVKKMGGGEVNPLTGDFVFEVREGYYIDKGEIAYPVKGATLVGNGPKVLEIIDMVGEDLHFEPGVCGKDGQGVPVSDGQPTLRIPELTVGGIVE